nr:MAG TPA: Helix-turn-helix XRE-family like protein [Caudoviricetes sp.]
MRTDRIIAERERLGWRQVVLAEELGVSKQLINGYEKGTRQPSIQVAAGMAKIFGCSIDYLVGLSDER